MKRAIVAPPALSPAALDELKAWLGVTTTRDDAELLALLTASLDLCEGFTGTMPIESGCEDVLRARGDWQALSARPVQAITALAALALDGARRALAAGDYEIDLDADGGGRVRLLVPTDEDRIAVTYTAGMAAGWEGLPEAIRQGLIRLAAFQHRERDSGAVAGLPPAAVAALWRPWRRVRLA
ncbi:MAG: hypothetical protein KGL48_07545 [Sphingomonadales bacterium]|nr:hypothetical protein [Sphingomonadales bacterium]MDE2568776.1 hypothetical protein [Sphingomonadales bacterium]